MSIDAVKSINSEVVNTSEILNFTSDLDAAISRVKRDASDDRIVIHTNRPDS